VHCEIGNPRDREKRRFVADAGQAAKKTTIYPPKKMIIERSGVRFVARMVGKGLHNTNKMEYQLPRTTIHPYTTLRLLSNH